MFAATVNPSVMEQQCFHPMKTAGYSHVIETQPGTRCEIDYLTRDHQRQIAVSVPNNAHTSRQATYYDIPLMTSQHTTTFSPDVEIQSFSYPDCQLRNAVFSALHQSEPNMNNRINFIRSDATSLETQRSSCQLKAPAITNSSCRLQEQTNISPSKPAPLGQLRLPTIKVTDNVAANVMSEEQDVGYCSISDISSFQELSDLSDVMNCSEESDELFSDLKSNFSAIIEDVLDSLDESSQSLPEETIQNSLEYSEHPLVNQQTYKSPTTHYATEQYHVMPTSTSYSFFDQPQTKWYSPDQFIAMNSHAEFLQQNVTSQCEICNKHFQTKASLRVHLRQHRGERPHQCPHCKKSFTQKSTLRTHIRTHTGERPYNCTFCARAFGDYSTYRKHVRVHTGEKPYQCDICNKSFTQSGNMIRHKTVHFKKQGLLKK